jgi:hypothetical protein
MESKWRKQKEKKREDKTTYRQENVFVQYE